MSTIKFTDLLHLADEDMRKLKLVFNSNWQYNAGNWPPEARAKLGEESSYFDLLSMYRSGKAAIVKDSVKTHNPDAYIKRYSNGDVVFSFIPYVSDKDWLLVNAYKVLDNSKPLIEADEESFAKYAPLFGRLVVHYANKARNVVVRSEGIIDTITVKTVLEQPYDKVEAEFPGYENINLSWSELKYVLSLNTWQTALKNQKGVYLITDTVTNKRYVGSAYGGAMLLGRWRSYIENGHGGNSGLEALVKARGFDYVKKNFRYSVLDFYKSTTDDKTIIARESWWKKVLLTRNPEFGYNGN